LFICGLSEGEEPALQGLTTSLIDRSYHARLFTSVAVVEILAKLVGGPIMGKLFSISQRHGPGSSGLCFSVSAVSRIDQAYTAAPPLLTISKGYPVPVADIGIHTKAGAVVKHLGVRIYISPLHI
jgi:hypothetical protein